jgi:anaerobic selenocysteine-containing dehydrogenase
MVQLGRVLTDQPPAPPITALYVYNANPVAMTPDQNRILAGLAREDLFTIVHEQVLTDTARFADVLLPATTIFEQTELHRAYGHYVLQYSAPVIEPLGESLTNPQVFARLARALDFAEPEATAEEAQLLVDALDGAGERLGGVDLDALRRERAATVRFGAGTALVQLGTVWPGTPSGRIELCPPELGPVDYRPVRRDGLVLLSPASDRTINSILGELQARPAVLAMHPDDAAARGLRDGEPVRVFNELGEVHVPLAVDGDVRRGVVTLPKGLWRSGTLNGATATALVPDALTDIGGGACFNDARVEVAALAR